jgi:hypothetical protein
MTEQQPGPAQAGPPQYSPDGRWWWDGGRWVAAPPPARPRRRWPWIAGGAAALVVLLGLCSMAAGGGARSQTPAAAQAAAQPGQAQPGHAQPAAPTAAARDGSCAPHPCANDDYGFIVTVSGVQYDASSGNDFQRPEAGNVYVTMTVAIVNHTAKERHADPTQFVLLDGAGVKHKVVFFLQSCRTWDGVNLTAGATLDQKCLAFEATAARPAGLTLVWTPVFLGGDYDIRLT